MTTDAIESAVTEPAAPDETTRSAFSLPSLTGWDAAMVLSALLLCVAFAPPLMFGPWTTRMMIVAPVGLAGLGWLARGAFRRDAADLLLVAALAWMLLGALLSDSVRSALVGTASRDLSALVVALCAGVFASGRATGIGGRALAPSVIVWALGASALVGLLQVVFDVQTGSLALSAGRPDGFATNPVYFGALCASGTAGAVGVLRAGWTDRHRLVLFVPLVVLAVGTSLSGSRVALISAAIVLVGVAAVERSRAAIIAVTVAAGGLATGVLLDRWVGAGRNAADRLLSGSGGGRTQVWAYGLEAWTERPIFGWGVGLFRPAVQGRFSADFVRDFAPDEVSQAWFDPHNVVINLLTTTGFVGVVLFGAWVAVAARRSRGPLAVALLPIAFSWMLQPVGIVVLPLAALMFGMSLNNADEASTRLVTKSVLVLAAVGALIGAYLLVADVMLRTASDDLDGSLAATAATLYGYDPVASDVVAQVYAFDDSEPERALTRLDWQRRAVDGEPDRPYWWSQLATRQIELGEYVEAQESLTRAIELQPFNIRTLRAEILLHVKTHDGARLRDALERSCALGIPECGLDAERLLDGGAPAEPPTNDE